MTNDGEMMRIVREYAIKDRIEKLMKDFVGVYSPTGTRRERSVEAFYESWFGSIDYLKGRPEHAGFFEIPGDTMERVIPWCAALGEGNAAVVLLHHYDVVDTDDYGPLAGIATSPDELMDALSDGRVHLGEDASRDLKSGEWIFARGAADMKGGASVQMALFEEYARAADRGALRGNVVIIGLPDEENLSAGGRSAALILKELKDRYGLDYRMAINSEPTDRTLGENRPKLYVSSIGKILPVIYASGALAHSGRVFEGLNPIKMMASVVRRLDLNPAFIDSAEGDVSLPATFLCLKDGKRVYDVSLPMSAMGCMNVMFLSKSVRDLVEVIRKNCWDAFEEAISDAGESFGAYMKASGAERGELPWKSRVVLYSDLYREAVADSGNKFAVALRNVISNIREKTSRGEIDQIEASRVLIETTLLHVNDRSPRIVVALAPPYYPVVANSMLDNPGFADSICGSLMAEALGKFGDEPVRHCLGGMSDFSYFLRNPRENDADYIKENMLLWGDIYSIPFEEIAEISMPIMNIGPSGKGIHTREERVWAEDLYRRVPHLLRFAVGKILEHD